MSFCIRINQGLAVMGPPKFSLRAFRSVDVVLYCYAVATQLVVFSMAAIAVVMAIDLGTDADIFKVVPLRYTFLPFPEHETASSTQPASLHSSD